MKLWQSAGKIWKRVMGWVAIGLRLNSSRGFIALFLVGASLSLAVAACSPGNNTATDASPTGGASPASARKQDVELTLVGYAIPRAAYNVIIPKFQEYWKQEHGQQVRFSQSYGGSGSQTRAIIDGLPADVVHLAVGVDVNKLVSAGFVSEDWQKRVPHNGTIGKTTVAIITREGNPKNIRSFEDLVRDDVKWVTADPKTSGGARWNFLALWDYILKTGGNDAKAKDFVTRAYKNVVVLSKDARESTDAFNKQGQGDALLNYENEVILAKQKGEKLDYIVPEINFAIDTPVAVVDKNVDRHGTREVAEGFVKFLYTPEAQEEFIKLGYRPLEDDPGKLKELNYPPIKTLGSVEDFGGWDKAQKRFFEDGAVFDEIRAQLGR
jgi:sulfate transport system substrate-binding protein